MNLNTRAIYSFFPEQIIVAVDFPLIYSLILGDSGAVSGGGKKSKRARILVALDFSAPEFFSRPFRLFPAPTNCPWVSEDDIVCEQRCCRTLIKTHKWQVPA